MNKKIKRYEIIIYISLILFSLLLGFIGDKIKQDTINSLLVGLSSGFLSVAVLFFIMKLANKDAIERQNEKISVVLSVGDDTDVKVPGNIRRADFSRQEVLGRIGMIPMKEKGRFSISYLNKEAFLDNINMIAESEGDKTLYIHCTQKEIGQFDLPNSRPR